MIQSSPQPSSNSIGFLSLLLKALLLACFVLNISLLLNYNNVVVNSQQQVPAPDMDNTIEDQQPTPTPFNIWDRARSGFGRLNSLGQRARGQMDRVVQEAFKIFARLYHKNYTEEEIPKRMQLFSENKKLVDESVLEYKQGKSSYALRVNQFTDWDDNELHSLTGTEPTGEDLASSAQMVKGLGSDIGDFMQNRQSESIPASKDWRKSGCVSTPINQKDCGACYAIATMSVVESMRCINGVSSPILSSQQIVDCASSRQGYQNYGCNGGWPTRVLKYLQDTNLAVRETCYPFVRRQNTCKINQVKSQPGCALKASPTDRRQLTYRILNNERDILHHVAKTGPVVTVMKATRKFTMYWTGIFDDTTCSNRRSDVDHAIVIVGYGKENGVDYWLIKNSWGTTDWGEGGYGKYRRGKYACSIGHWGWVVTG